MGAKSSKTVVMIFCRNNCWMGTELLIDRNPGRGDIANQMKAATVQVVTFVRLGPEFCGPPYSVGLR